MSDTPETDEHIWVYAEYDNRKLVDAEFARKLERERDEAIQARKVSAADWLNQIANADLRVTRIKRERDDLRNELNSTIRLAGNWEDDAKRYASNSDYWKAEAERWRNCHHEIIADRDWLILELVEISSTADNCENTWDALAKIGVIADNILNGREVQK